MQAVAAGSIGTDQEIKLLIEIKEPDPVGIYLLFETI